MVQIINGSDHQRFRSSMVQIINGVQTINGSMSFRLVVVYTALGCVGVIVAVLLKRGFGWVNLLLVRSLGLQFFYCIPGSGAFTRTSAFTITNRTSLVELVIDAFLNFGVLRHLDPSSQ
jgi:hypothetical protein